MWQRIILILLIIVSAILGFFSYVLRTKTQDVSTSEPFSNLIGNTLFFAQDVLLARMRTADQVEHPYTFYYLSEKLPEDVQVIDTLKKGNPLQIHKALLRKKGTSGISSIILLGECIDPKTRTKFTFEYEWGVFHFLFEEPYWTFQLAPWQASPDTRKYFLPNL